MKTHKFDPVSFVFGAAFIALSVILTSGHATMAAVRMKWLGGAFLLALGVSLLITSGRRA
jgi:predicted phage tail protein